jgi:hypothetical protein
LPSPDILAAEIIDDLKSALEQFEGMAGGFDPLPASSIRAIG